MPRVTIVIGFAVALGVARLLDSILTSRLVNLHGNGVKELNPFVNTESVFSIFFSPVPVIIMLGFLFLFAWMIYHSQDVLLAYQDASGSFFRYSQRCFWAPRFLPFLF
jgi:hypothetical protein